MIPLDKRKEWDSLTPIEWNEIRLLGILSHFPKMIDKLNFDSEYFSNPLHGKLFNVLKEYGMDPNKIPFVLHKEYANYLVDIYCQNCFDDGADVMALGYAKNILEEYKTKEMKELDDRLHLGLIGSDEYYLELTKVKNLTCEPQIDELTDELIDEMVSDDSKGLTIDRFKLLSSSLKIEMTDIITVAATSGFGKSAFLLNLYQALSQDKNTLCKCQYYNLEVAPKTMIKRLLAITSDVVMDDFNRTNLHKGFYVNAKMKIQNDSFINSGSITLEELKAKVLNNIDEDKINIIFIDHIGLLGLNDKVYNTNEYSRITYCMKEIRSMALDNNLIVFIASQFDRSSIKSDNLTMSSLKSSGEIENSSTHVLLLKESKERETSDKSIYQEVMIDIVKNRNGQLRKLDHYTFVKEKQRFNEKL